MVRSTSYGTIARLIGKISPKHRRGYRRQRRLHFSTIDLHALIDTIRPLRHMFLCSVGIACLSVTYNYMKQFTGNYS